MRLTKRVIAQLAAPDPSGKQKLHWDEDLRGFGVLCSGATEAKTFVVQRKLPGGLTRRVTIGAVNVLAVDAARARAKAVLAEFYGGHDPKAAARARARQALTLRDALEAYLAGRKDLRPKSVKDYRISIAAHLKDWTDRPMRDITPDEIEQRHAAIADEVKKRSGSGRRGGGTATGAASTNTAMRALRAAYKFAAERDPELPPNPTKRMRQQWFPVPRRERLERSDDLPAFYRRSTYCRRAPRRTSYCWCYSLGFWRGGRRVAVERGRFRAAADPAASRTHQGRAKTRSADEFVRARSIGGAPRIGG